MNITPKLLGVFANIYGSNDAMTFAKAALVAVVGFCTVLLILAIIALFIKGISAIFDKSAKKKKTTTSPIVPVPTAPSATVQPSVELINVDEQTAAIIMAIVSHRSGISLDRLAFKSIKLSEDK
ncbi:MAG: OadG family protein [Acutalibacteraceae bacterium]